MLVKARECEMRSMFFVLEGSVYGGSHFVQFCGLSCDVCLKGKDASAVGKYQKTVVAQ